MTAAWLRGLLFKQFALLIVSGLLLAARGYGAAGALLVVAGVPVGYLMLTGSQVLTHAIWCRRHRAQGCSAALQVRLWISEFVHEMRAFAWRQPWRARAWPDHPGTGQQGPGVVLVHGYLCNRGFWNPLLARLTARNTPWVAVNLEPMLSDIAAYAPAIEEAVARLARATGRAPVILAHSMGGLAVRAWLATGPAQARRVAGVITVGTPHAGTPIARWGRTRNAQQVRPASAWLRELQARESRLDQPPMWCVASACDQLVYPLQAAVLPGAVPVLVEGAGHLGLAFCAQTWNTLQAALQIPCRKAETGV